MYYLFRIEDDCTIVYYSLQNIHNYSDYLISLIQAVNFFQPQIHQKSTGMTVKDF